VYCDSRDKNTPMYSRLAGSVVRPCSTSCHIQARQLWGLKYKLHYFDMPWGVFPSLLLIRGIHS
jgi:hypothetical protein